MVLVVEDEDGVRELASEFLESAGCAALTAKDGTEALAIAEQSEEPIHLLLTDVVMPKMRGPELAKRLKDLRTKLRIVYMSVRTAVFSIRNGADILLCCADGCFIARESGTRSSCTFDRRRCSKHC